MKASNSKERSLGKAETKQFAKPKGKSYKPQVEYRSVKSFVKTEVTFLCYNIMHNKFERGRKGVIAMESS